MRRVALGGVDERFDGIGGKVVRGGGDVGDCDRGPCVLTASDARNVWFALKLGTGRLWDGGPGTGSGGDSGP